MRIGTSGTGTYSKTRRGGMRQMKFKPPPRDATERVSRDAWRPNAKIPPQSNEHLQRYLPPLEVSKPVSLHVGFIGRGYTRLRCSSPIFAHPERTNASQRQPRGIQDHAGYEPAKG